MFISKVDSSMNAKEIELLQQIHNNQPNHRGWFCLSTFDKNSPFNRYGHNLKDLTEYAMTHGKYCNWYLTYNSFRNWKRSSDNVSDISAFYLDLDVEQSGMDINEFDPWAIAKIANAFTANLVKFSGHGYYLIWFLDRQYYVNSPKFIREWQKIEDKLAQSVKKAITCLYGKQYRDIVDTHSTDPSRLLRVNFTLNTKRLPYQYCQPLDVHFGTHTFMEWVHKYLPPLKPRKRHTYNHNRKRRHYHKNSKPNHNKITMINPRHYKYSIFSLYWNRVKDLCTLAKIRGYHLNHNRDELLFLMATQLIQVESAKSVWKDIIRMNNDFKKYGHYSLEILGMRRLKYEILERTKAFRSRYRYSNQRIITLLNITPSEQARLLTLKKSKRSTDYLNHQAHLKRIKKQHQSDLMYLRKISKLENQGLTQTKIAKILGISRMKINDIKKRNSPYSNA